MSFPPCHPALDRALAARGYETPTEVQSAVLAADAHGRDLLVSARTGSGKTVAFGLASAPTLLGDEERFGTADAPLALVIAPTRELAMQVSVELGWLYGETGARVVTCVGGMDARKEARALNHGAHVVVGTPGRLRDHIERGNLDLAAIRVLVLDEADEMLDMGFKEDLEFILQTTPGDRRTLLFSATLAREIVTLARTYQNDALRIDAGSRDAPHGDIEYRAIRIAPTDMEHAVVNVLRYFEAPGAIVFCNTREAVNHLHASLRERGFSVVGLSGELSQRERTDALQALRDGHARVCVATDVAARGLDLPDLGLVIHAQLPVNKAGLLHRSGRTGRAGKKGVSVLLVSHTRRRKIELMLGQANIEATWSGPPSAETIRERDRERLLESLSADIDMADDELTLARELLKRRAPEQIAVSLIRAARAGAPEPEEVHDDERMKRDQERKPARASTYDGGDYAREADCDWFRINIGRDRNADPKWLLPLICRLGHVTKRDIGAIRIFERETKFEITREAAARFRDSASAAKEDGVKIDAAVAPAAGERTAPPRGGKPPMKFRDKPARRKDGERPVSRPETRPDSRSDRASEDRPKKPWTPRGDKPAGDGYVKQASGDRPFKGKRPAPSSAKPDTKPRKKDRTDKNKGKPKFKARARDQS